MRLIRELQRDPALRAICPECGCDFPLSKAVLFPLRGPIPEQAREVIEKRNAELADRRRRLREQRKRARELPGRTRVATLAGQTMEAVVPVLEREVPHREWRPLGDPIDYLVFRGLVQHGRVEVVQFVEVKTGSARTNARQRIVKEAVEAGRVRFQVAPGRERR
ncbi:MAG: Holliday junction resolvase-like protein [Armatimonadota bacterium]|nr:Holliday junction resolvase-like protein [Armatimonadota bacterium]